MMDLTVDKIGILRKLGLSPVMAVLLILVSYSLYSSIQILRELQNNLLSVSGQINKVQIAIGDLERRITVIQGNMLGGEQIRRIAREQAQMAIIRYHFRREIQDDKGNSGKK